MQGSRGMTGIPSVLLLFTVTVIPSGTAWFNSRHLDRGLRYVRDLPKSQIMSPSVSFNHLGPQLICVVGVV